VKQLLAFSRKQVLSLKVINVNNTIVSLSSLLERLLGEHIELNIDFGKNLSNVLADRVQLEQVIINLAVNARDAMASKGSLYVRTYNITIDNAYNDREYSSPAGDEPIHEGTYVIVEICDTGTGIPDDVVDNIFEPFFSTKDQLSGTGLGLATVYGIIKQIDGHIRFKTIQNQGTCFYILLKATTGEEDNVEEDDGDKTMSELLMNDKKDKSKILIVEDEAPVRLFEVHALTSKGYKVIDTGDAESAMNLLDIEGEDISLVITDVVMPGIKGPEMADKIKEEHPHIKFIFTSGYAEESLSYFDENKHHFLSKPFSLQTLLSKVKEVLEEDD
jgi:two-component system cell cycle sensor histidine kinase/response regulator CckA